MKRFVLNNTSGVRDPDAILMGSATSDTGCPGSCDPKACRSTTGAITMGMGTEMATVGLEMATVGLEMATVGLGVGMTTAGISSVLLPFNA